MATAAYVVSSGQRVELSLDPSPPTTVPSAYLLIEITGNELPTLVALDGKSVTLLLNEDRTRGFIHLDAFRSVGFHRLQVLGTEFIFGTEDAKLQLAGVLKMLDYLDVEGLSWGSQLYFTDGTAVRHPKVDFAWLMRVGQSILDLADDIAQRPSRRRLPSLKKAPAGSGRPLITQTLSRLRQSLRTSLEEHPAGPIALSGRHFMPRIAVTTTSTLSVDTVANRRLTWLLDACSQMCQSLRIGLPDAQRTQVREMYRRFSASLNLYPFSTLLSSHWNLPEQPAREEIADERYEKVYQYFKQVTDGLGWRPGTTVADRFAYVSYADEIYQAFVALTLARAFATQPTQLALTRALQTPSFASAEYSIYYDTTPATDLLPNWRDLSSRPSSMRPDLLIVHMPTQRGILLDAKYRVDPGDRPPTSALNECQVYMHSFDRNHIAVCYPGDKLQIGDVSGKGKAILQIPIAPGPGLVEYLRQAVRPRLEALLEPLEVIEHQSPNSTTAA